MKDANSLKFYVGKRLFMRAFREFAVPVLSGRVLDIGAGLAPYRSELSRCRVVTLEMEHRFRPSAVGSAQALPFAAGSFDGVICTEVLEHLADPGGALGEIRRVLKPGGHVYITTPMTWYLHYEPHDYFRFTPHGLKHLLQTHDLAPIRLAPIGGLPSVLAMVGLEKVVNLALKGLFFLPKSKRVDAAAIGLVPLSWIVYQIVSTLDRFSKRWIFSVCAVAEWRGHDEVSGRA